MIRLLILAFTLGAAWLQTRPALPPLSWAWALPLAFLLVNRAPGRLRAAGLLLLALAAGFLYAAWRAEIRLAEQLPTVWQGRDVVLLGRVLDLPETTPNGARFLFAVETTHTPGVTPPRRIQLAWRGRPGEAVPRIRGGDCLRFSARLYRPHGNVNPGGFDHEAWLLQRGIRASGNVVGAAHPDSTCRPGWRARLDAARERSEEHTSELQSH